MAMPIPIHQYASVPVAVSASSAVGRLQTDGEGLISTATTHALAAAGRWILSSSDSPTVTVRPAERTCLGTIELEWSGDEDTTAWPAIVGQVVVVPAGGDHSRLAFVSRRSPRGRLHTSRLDHLGRERMVDIGIQAFLHSLARELSPAVTDHLGAAAVHFDQAPMFVHHLHMTSTTADDLRERLLDDVDDLAAEATAQAIERCDGPLTAGAFRQRPDPLVTASHGHPDGLSAMRIAWDSDEEATGWPNMALDLVVEAQPAGGRLAVMSTREPAFDMSVNRVEKAQRDQILGRVGADVATAIATRLGVDAQSQEDAEVLVGTPS